MNQGRNALTMEVEWTVELIPIDDQIGKGNYDTTIENKGT